MKRKVLWFIVGVLILTLMGCGNDKGSRKPAYINANIPGNYIINKSYTVSPKNVEITLLLSSIDVLSDLSLRCNVIWSLKVNPGIYDYIDKYSDEGNTDMYLRDNQGNIYDHYDGDGGAYSSFSLYDGESISGAFYFPTLAEGATSFSFVDDDQGKILGPIEIRR